MKDYIEHYGIKGQKWGIRRFQNEDGTKTEEGKKRYYPQTETKEAPAKIEPKKPKNIQGYVDRAERQVKLRDMTLDDVIPGMAFVHRLIGENKVDEKMIDELAKDDAIISKHAAEQYKIYKKLFMKVRSIIG